MAAVSEEDRLSRITTCWSKVFEAHRGGADTVASARRELLERYCGAIYRYAAAALSDPDAAEDVLQEFAYCFVRGDFQRANPQKGRFRDLVKTVLFHLIVNYQRQRRKTARLQPLTASSELLDTHTPPEEADREFLQLWREELLDRAWAALAEYDRYGGHSWYAVLRHHAHQPDLSSDQLAKLLSDETGRTLTATSVRQILHRARNKFANLLIDEIARAAETRQRETIEQELIDLDLLIYCKSAMQKRYSL